MVLAQSAAIWQHSFFFFFLVKNVLYRHSASKKFDAFFLSHPKQKLQLENLTICLLDEFHPFVWFDK